jgi:trk system potassium uptake protein TrkA
VAILRDQKPLAPSRDDVVDHRDELFFISTIAAEDELRRLLAPQTESGGEGQVRPAQAGEDEDDAFDG